MLIIKLKNSSSQQDKDNEYEKITDEETASYGTLPNERHDASIKIFINN